MLNSPHGRTSLEQWRDVVDYLQDNHHLVLHEVVCKKKNYYYRGLPCYYY